MGLFCVNFHFQSVDDSALTEALDRRGIQNYQLLPAKRGWTSVYEQRASTQDDSYIAELAEELSLEVRAACIAFLVHDSDIACYWLFEAGRLVDQYNSFPNYFEESNEDSEPSGGRTDLLLPFCRRSVKERDLHAVLRSDPTFAEGIIEGVAEALGIDGERALADYNHIIDGEGPDGLGGFDDGDGGGGGGNDFEDFDDAMDDSDGVASEASLDDDLEPNPNLLPFRTSSGNLLNRLFGCKSSNKEIDPNVQALVEAAAEGDVSEIDRLLSIGTPIDETAPAPLANDRSPFGLTQAMFGKLPQIALTPLMAAIVNHRARAVEWLLDCGADPNIVDLIFGTPIHAASGSGEAEILRMLLDHGAKADSTNNFGQTPLQLLHSNRLSAERLEQVQRMAKGAGLRQLNVVQQLSTIELPIEGWDECERILRERP